MAGPDRNRNVEDDGYRPNVGIVLFNNSYQVLWARRRTHDGWQFPQGGVRPDETPEQALYRELYEEIGLTRNQVEVIARTRSWLKYDLPPRLRRKKKTKDRSAFLGQKQLWYLLRLMCDDSAVCLDTSSKPEFDEWRWIDYWGAVEQIVDFKRQVYVTALTELERYLPAPLAARRVR